jgi:hypothetical protein
MKGFRLPDLTRSAARTPPPPEVVTAVWLIGVNVAIGLAISIARGSFDPLLGVPLVGYVVFCCWDGRRWARLLYTVFAGLSVVLLPLGLVATDPAWHKAVTAGQALVSLVTIVLLWRAAARAYFSAEPRESPDDSAGASPAG